MISSIAHDACPRRDRVRPSARRAPLANSASQPPLPSHRQHNRRRSWRKYRATAIPRRPQRFPSEDTAAARAAPAPPSGSAPANSAARRAPAPAATPIGPVPRPGGGSTSGAFRPRDVSSPRDLAPRLDLIRRHPQVMPQDRVRLPIAGSPARSSARSTTPRRRRSSTPPRPDRRAPGPRPRRPPTSRRTPHRPSAPPPQPVHIQRCRLALPARPSQSRRRMCNPLCAWVFRLRHKLSYPGTCSAHYEASYFCRDERSRDPRIGNHPARALAEPAEYGQRRHHRLAVQ